MKIYLLKINLFSKEIINQKFYYSILGAILRLFNSKDIYDSIKSISPLIKNGENKYMIKLSILGEDIFNYIVVNILSNKNNLILDGFKFDVLGIDFNLGVLDLDNLKFKNFKNILINFKSPCFIKSKHNKKNINNYLPVQEIFMMSIIKRYLMQVKREEKIKDFLINLKEKIRKNIFICEFNIHTKQVKIKKGIKAGVIGKIKYKLNKNNNFTNKELTLIYNSLLVANYIGIGNSTKLGLGQVKVNLF